MRLKFPKYLRKPSLSSKIRHSYKNDCKAATGMPEEPIQLCSAQFAGIPDGYYQNWALYSRRC